MEKFVTLIQAIDPKDGNLKTFYDGDFTIYLGKILERINF